MGKCHTLFLFLLHSCLYSTDPEPRGKSKWWLPGCSAGWERLLYHSIPTVVTLHYRQRHQRRAGGRNKREPFAALLHGFSGLQPKDFPSTLSSGASATTEWNNTIRVHRSWWDLPWNSFEIRLNWILKKEKGSKSWRVNWRICCLLLKLGVVRHKARSWTHKLAVHNNLHWQLLPGNISFCTLKFQILHLRECYCGFFNNCCMMKIFWLGLKCFLQKTPNIHRTAGGASERANHLFIAVFLTYKKYYLAPGYLECFTSVLLKTLKFIIVKSPA